MIVTYDTDKKQILQMVIDGKTYKIEGECNRCGACCGDCPDLIKETLDGKIWCSCRLQHKKPIMCVLHIPNIKNCGLKMVLIDG